MAQALRIVARVVVVIFLVVIVPANTGCLPGCGPLRPILKPKTPGNPPPSQPPKVVEAVFDGNVGECSTGVTDMFIGALVVESTDQIGNMAVIVDDLPITISSSVDDVKRSIIRQALQQQGILNSPSQTVLFFQTNAALTISPDTDFTVAYEISRKDGAGIVDVRTAGGGTLGSLLTPTMSPDDLFTFNEEAHFPTSVPTVSILGLIVLTIGMLAVGLFTFRSSTI